MPSRIEVIDCGPSCLGPPAIDSDFEDADGESTSRRSRSYRMLSPHLLKLSILKLDGSAFDVIIEKSATVGQLKQAIEDVFISDPKEGHGQISWSHVWGHFCLSFVGRKLLNDRTYIREFGIMDGDQLQFVRHFSICHSPLRRNSKSWNNVSKQPPLSASGETEDSNTGDEENQFKYYYLEDRDDPLPESELSHFLNGCLSPEG